MEGESGRLGALLALERIEDDIFRTVEPHVEGAKARIYGGQVAAQSLVAAGRTVSRGTVHSLHSYFLRPGDPDVPIVFDVDRIRDGRSFTTRRVVAIQHGEAIFNLQCSFHVPEEGPEHWPPAPEVPRPESLPDATELDPRAERRADSDSLYQEIEVRFVTEAPWQRNEPGRSQQVWIRARSTLEEDPLLHAAAITFVSDLTLLDAALQPLGLTATHERFAGASLDHCMWFHRAARGDRWLLYDQHSPSSSNARGLGIGVLYTLEGELAVTVAQEGLLRFRRPEGAGGPAGPAA